MAENKTPQQPQKPTDDTQPASSHGQDATEAAAETQATAAGDTAQAPADQQPQTAPQPADVYDLLRFTLGVFLNQAWIHLGIRAAPGTTETVTDLPKARVAIDTAVLLFDKLKPQLTEQETKEIELELSNLRINFARKA